MKGYTIQHSIDLLEKKVENSGGGSSGGGTAADVSYSNTSSGLVATNVQSAIDEIDGVVDNLLVSVTTLLNGTAYTTTETKIGTFDGLDLFSCIHKLATAVTLGIDGAWVPTGVTLPDGVIPILISPITNYMGGSIGIFVGASGALSLANIQKVGNITLSQGTSILTIYTKPAPTRNKKGGK